MVFYHTRVVDVTPSFFPRALFYSEYLVIYTRIVILIDVNTRYITYLYHYNSDSMHFNAFPHHLFQV